LMLGRRRTFSTNILQARIERFVRDSEKPCEVYTN
jgi:hypothetical protein